MAVTVMLTCFSTALSTIGASRQRQVLRFSGFVVGGLLIGMSSQVFILPYLDSITAFTVLFILVTALAAWFMTSSPRLSFFGLQLAVVFFVINMQKFARETSLSVARDRVAGSLPGAADDVVDIRSTLGRPGECRDEESVYFHFASAGPVRPGAGCQRTSSQRSSAPIGPSRYDQYQHSIKSDHLRMGFFSNSVPRGAKTWLCATGIRRWQPQLRALFLMRVASLKYRLQLPGFVLPEAVIASLQAYDECSAQMLENLADRMEGKPPQEGLVSSGSVCTPGASTAIV